MRILGEYLGVRVSARTLVRDHVANTDARPEFHRHLTIRHAGRYRNVITRRMSSSAENICDTRRTRLLRSEQERIVAGFGHVASLIRQRKLGVGPALATPPGTRLDGEQPASPSGRDNRRIGSADLGAGLAKPPTQAIALGRRVTPRCFD